MIKDKYTLDDLVDIVAILRGENGCPWDREQTHDSLKKYLIEETYEVLDAIEKKDPAKICDELGDLLLQVLLHARIAEENGDFDLNDVATSESKKMVMRHTHIFGDEKAETSADVMRNWERNKRREKGLETHTNVLRDIPAGLPALVRAMKVQQKASAPGMDFAGAEAVFAKLDEELAELRAAYEGENQGNVEDEFGDLLFTMVNLSRFMGVHPELSLSAATEKFLTRFELVEKAAHERKSRMEDMTPEELDALWEEVKREAGKQDEDR